MILIIMIEYHDYLTKLWNEDSINLPLVKPEKWDIGNPDSCKWIVLTILNIQDDLRTNAT